MKKLILFFLLIASCGQSGPVDFGPGEFNCESCQMGIVNPAFKAEIISPKGKVHRFDSIECLVVWSKEHPDDTQTRWVVDFYSQKWVSFEKAFFLKSEKLPSPMGAFLSAYGTLEELEKAKQEFGGSEIKPEAL